MPYIMVVLDGLQDITYPELDGKSPYDWGKGKAFAEIESACAKGFLVTTPSGFEPDTQTCILTLLGVETADIPSGRSCIEALALGVAVGEDDIVLRSNFVKLTPDGLLADPTCSAPEKVANMLRAAIASIPGHTVTPVGTYKSLQAVKGGGRFAKDMRTFPPHNYAGRPFEELLPSGNGLADFLAEFSQEQLKLHAPYTVLNWAQSTPSALPSFASLHGGMTGGMVSATHAPMGCAIAMGMECPAMPTATGDTDTDLSAKLEAALKLSESCDFTMLHVGGPDEATHRKNAKEKAEFVSKLDKELISPLLSRVPNGTGVMITCDHVALCATGGHTAEPVGFMLYQKAGNLSGDIGVRDGKTAVEVMKELCKAQ